MKEIIKDWSQYILEAKNQTKLSNKSKIWNDLFSIRKKNYEVNPSSPNEFLDGNIDSASGTAGTSIDKKWRWDSKYLKFYFENLISHDEIIPEESGIKGNYKIHNINRNIPFWWNYLTFSSTSSIIKKYLTNKEKLRICEIGPGYGCAANLYLKKFDIESYTLIDLKENMINSIQYLSVTNKNLNIVFIKNEEDFYKNDFKDKLRINICLPEYLDKIDLKNFFDLVINTDSFGEMPRETAISYMFKAHKMLKNNGLIFSANGIRRGHLKLEGINDIEDYQYTNASLFELLFFGYKPHFSSALDEFGHYALVRKKNMMKVNSEKERKIFLEDQIKIISYLFGTGIKKDFDNILIRLNDKNLKDSDLYFLDNCKKVLEGKNSHYQGKYDYIIHYLRNMYMIYKKDSSKKNIFYHIKEIEKIINKFSSCLPIYYFTLTCWIFKYRSNIELPKNAEFRYAYHELEKVSSSSLILRLLFAFSRKNQLRKRFLPFDKFKPSKISILRSFLKF